MTSPAEFTALSKAMGNTTALTTTTRIELRKALALEGLGPILTLISEALMIDPGQLSSAFLAGPVLTSGQLDISADRIAYFWWNASANHGAGEYILSTVSPEDLYTAMSDG